ncbi:MAG: hypothetical protein A2073_00720 [Deltaproteobacteria bacterium GWC2_42_11]|nr:MAG: hypothetical protein A2073_00720 [Deltaproteobacteria bacterium GWC2_42_11]HBO83407.1 hypothetical protein [Deltaproteobacteria bacterium]
MKDQTLDIRQKTKDQKLNTWVLSLFVLFISRLFIPTYAFSQELIPFNEEIKSPRYAIGVILPLSGKYAGFGEDALKGVLLAAGVFDRDADMPVEVIVKDSKDDPYITSSAVTELAADSRVMAIIGPMLSITASEAAKRAQELKIPIITLSQKEGLPQTGRYVFRNFLTQSMQARVVARFAANVLKFKRFAIFYPDNPYGKGLAVPFKDEVRKNGGEVVAEGMYSEGQADFGHDIKKLFKVSETEKKEGRRTIKSFNPALSVDALYIPDYFDTVSLIVPNLAYFNIKGVKLLGSNGWNSQKLAELGGKYVEGSIFADGFFLRSTRYETRLFADRFIKTYGIQAGILGAEAFDASSMTINLLREGKKNREAITDGLARLRYFKGATGNITFDAEGDAIKELFILTIINGEIVQIN